MSNKEMKKTVENLKDELKESKTEAIITCEDSKVKKVVTYVLKGVALVATGLVGFFIGRGVGGKDEDDTQEEKATEE